MKPLLSLALVLALLAAAPADAATSKYTGRTSQNLNVTIKLKGGSIDDFLIHIKNNCGATNKPIEVTGPIEIADNGRFSANLGDGEFTLSGRFAGDSVQGKVRQRYEDALFGTCDTKKVTFSAQR